MADIIELLQFGPGKHEGKDAMILHLNRILKYANKKKLISRHSDMISSNAVEFRYWLGHYYDKFIVLADDNIFKEYLPIATILHSIIALKFKLPHDAADDMPLYNMDRSKESIYITSSNQLYFSSLYHALLDLIYIADFKEDDSIMEIFMYYYHVYILERSPMEERIKTDSNGFTYRLGDDALEYLFNYLENEQVMISSDIFIVGNEINVWDFFEKLYSYNMQIYRNMVINNHNFFNFVSYKLYIYELDGKVDDRTFNKAALIIQPPVVSNDYYYDISNLNYLRSYAYDNYLLLHAKNMRRAPLARQYKVIYKPITDLIADLSQLVNSASNNAQVNIVLSNILLQRHIAQYGLLYPLNHNTWLCQQLYENKNITSLLHAITIKMGLSRAMVYSLSEELLTAVVLTGVLPTWSTQNLNYERNMPAPIKHCNFILSNYCKYRRLLFLDKINVTAMIDILHSTDKTIIITNQRIQIINCVAEEMLLNFTTYLPQFENEEIMQAPLNRFKLDVMTMRPKNRKYIQTYRIMDLAKLKYIDFTFNNKQLCDKYNLANIYPRFHLLYLIVVIMQVDNNHGRYAYSRLPSYQLGDGKLYSYHEQKEIHIDYGSGELIKEMLLGDFADNYHIANLISIIYALNLLAENNIPAFNRLLIEQGIFKLFELVH